jgi:hypothetical protein
VGNHRHLTTHSPRAFIGIPHMTARVRPPESLPSPLPNLRFEIVEAAQILRMSRAQLYNRIQEGCIRLQKDGSRSYITHAELERYVDSCGARTAAAG